MEQANIFFAKCKECFLGGAFKAFGHRCDNHGWLAFFIVFRYHPCQGTEVSCRIFF